MRRLKCCSAAGMHFEMLGRRARELLTFFACGMHWPSGCESTSDAVFGQVQVHAASMPPAMLSSFLNTASAANLEASRLLEQRGERRDDIQTARAMRSQTSTVAPKTTTSAPKSPKALSYNDRSGAILSLGSESRGSVDSAGRRRCSVATWTSARRSRSAPSCSARTGRSSPAPSSSSSARAGRGAVFCAARAGGRELRRIL